MDRDADSARQAPGDMMCGRYKMSAKTPQILAAFGLAQSDVAQGYEPTPRYNVAPTDQVPVVRVAAERRVLVPMRWGLIPFWAKDESIGVRTLNARAETLHEKPAFRDSLEHKRCVVVADGFYEWRALSKKKGDKQPYLFCFEDRHVFAFAGLWARWKGPAGPVESCTVITTPPNPLVAPVHDRMPAIFDPAIDQERINAWLDPSESTPDLATLQQPRDLPGFIAFPVDRRVGNVKNDDPSLAVPELSLLNPV